MKKWNIEKKPRWLALLTAVVLLVSGTSFAGANDKVRDSGRALTNVQLYNEAGEDLSKLEQVDFGSTVILEYTFDEEAMDSGDAGAGFALQVPKEINLSEAVFSDGEGKVISPTEVFVKPIGASGKFRVQGAFDRDQIGGPGKKTLTFPLQAGKSVKIDLHFSNALSSFADDSFVRFMTGYELYRAKNEGGEWVADGEPLSNGATISNKVGMIVKYTFEARKENVNTATDYQVPLPGGLSIPAQTNPMDLHNNSGVKFATMTIKNDAVTVRFVDDFRGITGANIYLYSLIPAGDKDKESIKVKWHDNMEWSFTIEENKPKAAEIVKEGAWKDGNFLWTITYTPASPTYTGSPVAKIVDTFPSKFQAFVAGSFSVKKSDGNSISVADSDLNMSVAGEAATMTYKIPADLVGEALTITYKTGLTDAAVAESNDTKVSNKASLRDASESQIGKEAAADATAKADNKKFVTKTGAMAPGNNRELLWTVTINTVGRNLDNLKLEDTLPEGLTLKGNQVHFKGETVDQDESVSFIGKTFTVDVPKSASGAYEASYAVTYTTTIDNSYFEEGKKPSNDGKFHNGAKLHYTWNKSDGTTATEYGSANVGIGVNTDLIQKKAAGYDPATHRIKWTVTVNPNLVDMRSATVTDSLTGKPHTFAEMAGALPTNVSLDNTNLKEPVFTIGNIGQNKVEFSFWTELDETEKDAYGSNLTSNRSYNNKVTLSDVTIGGVAKTGTWEAAASQQIKSTVLTKKSEGYDFSTNELKWKITVNENKMPMDGVVVTDILPEGLRLKGDPKVDSAPFSGLDNFTQNGQTLTFKLRDMSANDVPRVITYTTEVDVDSDRFKTDPQITISNTATLKRDGGFGDVSSQDDQELRNDLIAKTGARSGNKINYTVNINPHRITFKGENTLYDTMPLGLMLEMNTVKLYEATVNSQGKFTKGALIPLGDKFEYKSEKRVFTVQLLEGAKAYVLEYTARITDPTKAPFTNKISLNDAQSGDAGQGDSNVDIGGGGGGGGGGDIPPDAGSITVKKLDAMRETIAIPGAVFQLLDKDQNPMYMETTDENGELTFSIDDIDVNHIIREVSAPAGYQLAKDIQIIPAQFQPDANITITVNDEPKTGEIVFEKRNDWDRLLTGATFKVTDQTSGSTYTATAESVDGVVRFEGIPFGTYHVEETDASANHVLNRVIYTAEITPDGTFTGLKAKADGEVLDTVVNISEKTTVTVVKTDKSSRAPMANVAFTIYDSLEEERGTGKTDKDGKLVFEDLMVGETYTIKEKTPSGYQPSPDKTVDVLENRPYEVLWENERVPETPVISTTPSNSGGSGGSSGGGSGNGGGGQLKPPVPPVPPAVEAAAPPTDRQEMVKETTSVNTPRNGTFDAPPDSHFVLTDPPNFGTVEVKNDGRWTYTPVMGFRGTDSFVVEVRTPKGDVYPVRVLVTIEDEPVAKSPANTGRQ